MIEWYNIILSLIAIIGYRRSSDSNLLYSFSICIFILSSLVFNSSLLFHFINRIRYRVIAKWIAWIRFLTSRDPDLARSFLLSNCQHIYKKRIRGKTKCNYLRYYGCKLRDTIIQLPLHRHTLILDLDETLVYSCRYSDLSLMIPSLESIGVTILRNNKYVSFYVYKRPHLDEFLDCVCEWFNVVVFTAGERPYADAVLNVIDPKGRVRKRLYKDDCMVVNGTVVKRVETACPNAASAMIIDNNPECFRYDKCELLSDRFIHSKCNSNQ